MYGVVLWSDRQKNCAVIWCEDHRQLAFFRKEEHEALDTMAFDAGDLVEFDIRQEDELRLAIDPSVVTDRYHTSLAGDLIHACANTSGARAEVGECRTSLPGQERGLSHVLRFPDVFGAASKGDTSVPDKNDTSSSGRKAG